METSHIGAVGTAPISLPARTDFGHDHYLYRDGQRLFVGTTRTIRPGAQESGYDFRRRVNELALILTERATRAVEVDEEVRGGVIVQATIRVTYQPEPTGIQADTRKAGGRPAGPRGTRGGI